MVAHSFARISGSRSGSTVVFMPNLSRFVRPATAASVLNGSRNVCAPTSRSLSHTESTAVSSVASIQRQNAAAEENGNAANPNPIRTLMAVAYPTPHAPSGQTGKRANGQTGKPRQTAANEDAARSPVRATITSNRRRHSDPGPIVPRNIPGRFPDAFSIDVIPTPGGI